MTRFRQALLDELQSRVANPDPAPRAARSSLRWLAFGAGALAAAVIAAAIVIQGGGTPAYAVTANPDGTVLVTVNRIEDPAPANRALREISNRVVVMRPSAEDDCPVADRGNLLPLHLADAFRANEALEQPHENNQVRIRPDYIPSDAVLVLVPVKPDEGGGARILRLWYATPGPRCLVYPPLSGPVPVPTESAHR